MRLTLAVLMADQDELLPIDVNTSMTLADFKAYVESETGIPTKELLLFFQLNPLLGDDRILNEWGFQGDDMIVVERKIPRKEEKKAPPEPEPEPEEEAPPAPPENPLEAEIERLRMQINLDAGMRQRLLGAYPDLTSVIDNPVKFREKMIEIEQERRAHERAIKEELRQLTSNPDDEDNQRRIMEIIRKDQIADNLQTALEHNPEVFGQVIMLYINVEVNGVPVKAFVDSGAQATIINPECAERCGILRLLDTRFKGVAKGVGTANILGRIHSAPIKVGDSFLPCSFTVLEGQSVELLLGLDMLKRHQGIIDLRNNVLIMGESATPFLGEAEIGDINAYGMEEYIPEAEEEEVEAEVEVEPASVEVHKEDEDSRDDKSFSNEFEGNILQLMNLGFTRERAVQALEMTEGNPDLAASLLFQ